MSPVAIGTFIRSSAAASNLTVVVLRDKAYLFYRLQPGDPAPKAQAPPPSSSRPKSDGSGMGLGLYAALFLGVGLAYGAYAFLKNQPHPPQRQ